eukprot:6213234-Pleurochrysis_carterae.AAC.3
MTGSVVWQLRTDDVLERRSVPRLELLDAVQDERGEGLPHRERGDRHRRPVRRRGNRRRDVGCTAHRACTRTLWLVAVQLRLG